MGATFLSLLCIVIVAFFSPLISWVVPRRIVPETVLLIVGGLIIGPATLGIAHETVPIEFLRELGLAFLFLMAGYEIDANELRGSGGRHALIAWVWSLAAAFAMVAVVGVNGGALSVNGIAIAIAMTSTAIGTILPILRERGLLQTAVGAAILNHGAIGEVAPIILMALLLGSRATWKSVLILLVFLAITLLIIRFTDRVRRAGRRLVAAIHLGGSTTAQTTVRLTVLLLVGLCTLAEMFDLDVVLGAFAAGFILRYAVPDGSRELEEKLDGLAYGFFVPIFFVTSGMAIELSMSGETFRYIGAILVALVVVRGVPVWVASRLERRRDGTRAYSLRQSLQIGVYSTTALPIIVAVTQAAVSSGAMGASVASTLVLAGVASVLIMPALGLCLQSADDRKPVTEALGLAQGPQDAQGREVLSADTPVSADRLDGSGQAQDGVSGQGLVVVTEPRRPAGLPTPSRGLSERNAAAVAGSGASRYVAGAGGADAVAGTGGRPARVFGYAGHSLTESEAHYLAERLAQIEVERMQWRAAMRRQRSLDREESMQRRAVRRALTRERRREDREQVRRLRREAMALRQRESAQEKSGAQEKYQAASGAPAPTMKDRVRRGCDVARGVGERVRRVVRRGC